MTFASHLRKDVGRTLRDKRGVTIALLLPAGVLLIYSALDLGAFTTFGRDPDAFILVISTSFPALLSASTALVEERRLGTFQRLERTPAQTASIVGAKLGAGLVVSALQVAALLAVAPFLLGKAAPLVLPNLPLLAVLLVLNGLAAYAFGLLLSSLVSTEAQAMQLTSLSLLVMLTLSGFLQPLSEIGRLGAFAEALPMALGYSSLKGVFVGLAPTAEIAFFLVDVVLLVAVATLVARLRR